MIIRNSGNQENIFSIREILSSRLNISRVKNVYSGLLWFYEETHE